MTVPESTISWEADEIHPVQSAEALMTALARATEAAEVALIVSVEAGGAALTHVVGDPSGSTLVYFPANYPDAGVGSMHSVGDRAMRDADDSEPLQVAYMNGHYSELPRWMVVPLPAAEAALREFVGTGGALPSGIEWEED
jgi:hypothetical protein